MECTYISDQETAWCKGNTPSNLTNHRLWVNVLHRLICSNIIDI